MDAENKLNAGSNAVAPNAEGGDVAAMAAAASEAIIAALQALTLVPEANGQVVLPAGVELDDIRVSGRDLIIALPDGTQMVIPDGAVFVPQFVLNGIAVPPLNIAALLIGQETAPAAGRPTSSGGNFADPVGDIGDPFDRGDLLPPTQLGFPEPEEREIIPDLVDEEPTTIIITPDQPAGSASATASVNEAGLPARGSEPAGSNEPANSETTTGTIVFDAPDGLASITLNGVEITAVGQVFTTPYGSLTITSIATGNIGYSYTLADNSNAATNPSDVFAVVVIDSDGDAATANLTISIIDDAPTARNDTDTVPAATYTAQTGNVMTGVGTTSGSSGADTQGADAATISGFRAGTAGSFAGAGTTINGQYGTLRLNADGSYSYTRSAGTPGGVTDTFSYQLTDGDGDISTATLVISIANAPVSITSVPTTGAGTIVDEEGLPARGTEPPGSNSVAPVEATSGTITFDAPDGVASVQINGTVVTGPGQVITLPTGNFVVTGYNPTAGTLGYTFTLTDNTTGDTTTQVVTVTVTDTDGDSDVEPFTITIIDDTPTARDDGGAQTAENTPITVNVFANDTPGADGVNLTSGVAVIAGSLTGTGTLAYNNDGTFTYAPAAGEEGTVTFRYLITDGDGDTSPATVTINLAEDSNPSVLVSGGREVEESGLPARGSEPAGSNAASNGEVATGTIAIATGNDSIGSLVINGVNVTAGGTVTGAHGTLVVALSGGTYIYTYTLTDNTAGNTTSDSFDVVLTDSDGDSATDTLTIAIVDDVPTAADDTDSLLAGATGPATGNVLTDAEDDGGADTEGADGATVTAITGFGGAGTIGGTTTGQYGTLTINADGSYSYVRTGTGPINATDVFTYTLTDGDSDSDTATLTITLTDAAPSTGRNLDVLLDDDALTDGNPGGIGDDVDAANVAGTLAGSGGDGALTWAFQLTGAPSGFAYVAGPAGSVLVQQGGTTVLTITLNGATGAYTVTQNAAIDHATLGDENNSGFTLGYSITDADGDQANGTLSINVDDDTPLANSDVDSIVSGSSAPATGNVITDAEGDGGEDFVGADGGGAIVAITGFGGAGAVGGTTIGEYGRLTINADGSYSYVRNSGTPGNVEDIFTYTLTDGDGDTITSTLTIIIEDERPIVGPNAAVLLDDDVLANGNTGGTGDDTDAANVTGTLSGSGGDGALTWALQLSGAPSGFSYVAGPAGSVLVQQGGTTVLTITLNAATGAYTVTQNAPIQHAAGNDENNQGFTLNYTVSDVDGDSTPGTLTIDVDDDTPVVSVNGEAPFLVVDETSLTTNDTQDLSGLFSTPPQYGADGAGSVTYALGAVAGPSGLIDTLTGQAVNLAMNGAVVEGRTTGGALVFTVSVDASGNVTLDQSRAVVHTPDGGPNDVASLVGNLVTLTQTVTDSDGDSADAVADIGGMVRFIDDAPTGGANAAVQLDDDSLGGNAGGTGDVDPNTANTSGTLSHTFGNDGGSIAFETSGAPAGYRYTASGSNVLIQQEQGAGNWVTVATVTLVPTTGAYTVTQNAPVIHPLGGNENDVSFTLSYLVTDGDLDTAPGTLVINIDDDTPTAVAGSQTGTVDEDGLANGLEFGTDDVPGTATTANGSIVSFFSAGADTPLTYQLTGSTAGLPALTSGGVAVTYAISGNVLTASAGANPVFTLTLNAATGQWDFALLRALDHANGVNENDIILQFGSLLQATDRDGDSVAATGTLTITIDDDSPIAGGAVPIGNVSVDETNAVPGGFPISASSTGAMIAAGFFYGADGAATSGTPAYTISLTGTGATSLVTALGGFAITLVQTNATTITGQYSNGGNQTAFIVSINAATGIVTLTQNIALEHNSDGPEGPAHNDVLTLAGLITATVTITDRDGDSHEGRGQIGGNISFFDDGPSITATGVIPALTVDETVLNANAGPTSFAGVFTTNFGADGGTQIAYALNVVAGPSGLIDTLTGQAVNLVMNGAVVEGRTVTSGDLVFTVSVNASGQVTLDQIRAVMHTPNSGPNQSTILSAANLITLTATATDNDGDTDSALIDIGQSLLFLDDAPTGGANAAVQLDDDSLGGNAGGTGDVDPDTANTTGILAHSFGNDGGSIAFETSGAPAGYRYTTSGSNVLIQQEQGAGIWVTVATVTLVPTTGAYTVTQNAAIIHPLGGNENDVSFTLSYLVTDGDLDTAPGTLVINIDDDTPIAVAGAQSGIVDEDGLANGITVAQTGDVADANTTATGFVTGLFDAGADTPLTYQLTGSTAGLPVLTSGGTLVTYTLTGNVLTANAGLNPVFTLTLDATTGQWDFALLRPLDHANGGNENDIILQFGSLLQATDRDGDPVSAIGTLTITIDDDSPLVTNAAAAGSVSVDETNAVPGGFPITADSGTSIISATLAYGADGAQVAGTPAYSISLTGLGGTSLVTALGGFAITLVQTNATTITGQYANGGTQTAFTISINATTGVLTLTQNIALEHNSDGPAGPAHDDVLTLAGLINATVTITDRDGDSHEGSAQIGGNISFFDDGPAAVADTNSVTEGALVTGNVLTDGTNDAFGADGAAITSPAGGVVGVAAGNNTATPVSGGVGTAITTGLGTLTLQANGSYTYDALPNTTAVAVDDIFVYTIMDSDGDTSTVTLTITINPVTLVADDDTIAVNEAALNANGSNPGLTTETNGGTLTVAGAVGYTLPGGGAGTYGTLTLNANGSYSYTLTTPYDSATADDGANTELGRDVFTYTATDANGNTITGTITVDIIDDVPTARDDAAGLTEGGPIFVTLDVDTNDTPGADGTGTRTFTTLTGIYGNLVLNPGGTQTYTLTTAGQTAINALAPGATLQDVFSYTLTDGDGDTDPALLTITLTGTDDLPEISNLTPEASGGDTSVDEDDLPLGSDTTPDSLTGVGNFTITAPDGVDDLTVGGVAVIVNGVFQPLATLTVTTPLGNTLTFTGYNSTTGVVSYTYTLAGAETHANATGENDLFENFAVSLTDVDNDLATGTLSVRIVDDVPTANDDAQTQSAENAPITVNVIANDVRGADGVNLASGVAVVAGSLTGTGTLAYNGNGTFTYTPGAGEIGPVTFQYTITDADNDSDPATVTLTLLADSTPQVANVIAAVDDEGLSGGIVGLLANGDIDANIGDSGAGLGDERIFVGQINVNFGGDTGTVSFENLHGTTALVGTETVTYGWNAGNSTLTATGPRGALFTVNLTPSGTYTVTLLDNVLHASGGNETSALVVNLNYLASDSDGDTDGTGVLAITFNDDAPTLGIVQNQQASNTASDPVSIGTLHFAPGADGAGSTMTINANMTGITSGGRAIFTQQSGNVLTGYADTDGSGGVTVGVDVPVFTLTVNATAGTSGQYVFDLLQPLDGTTVNASIGQGSSFGVGPTDSVIVSNGATQLALVTGWEPTGGFTPAELALWQGGGIPVLTQRSDINGSTAGWGLQNNVFNAGEFLRFDFGVVNDYDGPGGYVPPAAGPLANVSYATFRFSNNWDTGDSVIFVVHYTNNTTATFTRNAATDSSTFTINSPAGTQIAWIDAYQSGGAFKLDLTDVGVTSTVVDRTIPFTLQLTDADGDATTSNAFTVRVGGGLTPLTPAAMAGINLAKFAMDDADSASAPQQIQQREQTQSNSLMAASLIALVGADVAMPESVSGTLPDDAPVRDVGLDPLLSIAGLSDPITDAGSKDIVTDKVPVMETIKPIELDDMPHTQLWETTGLAPQEMPVVQQAPIAINDAVQLPNSGASMLSLPTDTGLVDALLLARAVPVEAVEPQLAALQDIIADTLNDNGIDQLLDQLAGPVGESPLMGGNDDVASALINMPVANDAFSHFSGPSIADQLQDMATTQA
jgi:large repetitive protein